MCRTVSTLLPWYLFFSLSLPYPKGSDAVETGQDLVAGGLGSDHSTALPLTSWATVGKAPTLSEPKNNDTYLKVLLADLNTWST